MPEGYTVENIDNCGVNVAASDNAFPIFNNITNLMGGWSHISDTPQYANLAMEPSAYAFADFGASADASCNELQSYNAILVKKYADWDAQHSSGLTAEFLAQDIQFGEVDEIVLELKVNSNGSSIPTLAEIEALYGEYLTDTQLANWDHGKINLGITLYAEGHDDQTTATVSGLRIIELDEEVYFDEWVRVTIPADSLYWYSEMSYSRTALATGAWEDGTVLGLRINPETKTEVVLRNFIADDWETLSPAPEEMFKEMDISIKNIELRLK